MSAFDDHHPKPEGATAAADHEDPTSRSAASAAEHQDPTSQSATAAAEHQDPTPGGLREAAVSGIRWLILGRVGGDITQFAAAVALARMISPAEFGHAAIALILVPLAAILTFEGFGSALVQRKTITQRHIAAATLASVTAGAVMTVLALLGAPLVVAPVFGDRTAALVQLASPLFFVAGLSAVARSVLWRRLEFRAVTLIETGSMSLGAVASVVLAAHGLNGAAIVIGALGTGVAATAVMLVIVRPVAPRWHSAELRDILGFGSTAAGAGLLHVAITNVDYTIVAARLGAAQTGFYWRAFQLGVVYQDKISGIMMRLAFPIYSRTRDLDEMRRLHERATRVHAAVVVPLLAVLIVIAPVLVPWLFGPRWTASVLPAQILAVAGMVAAILTGFAQVLLAAGRPRALLQFNIGVLIVYAGVVWICAPHGIVAVSIGVVAVYLGMLAVVYGVLFRRVVGIPVSRMVGDLAPAVVGGLALLAVGFPLCALLRGVAAPVPVVCVLVGLAGLAVHALVLRRLFPSVWRDLVTLAERVAPTGFSARRRHRGVVPSPTS